MTSYKRFLSLMFAMLLICGALIPAFTLETHAEKDKITVMLDPGHAYGDGGGTYANGTPECYYNMIIALACKEALEAHGGFEVYLSHPDNYTQATLLERAMAADKVDADVIVSIHIDGSTDPNFKGASALYSVIDKFALPGLANGLLSNLTAKTGISNRGTYRRKDTGDGTHVYYWDAKAQWDVPDDFTVGPLSDYYGIITWGAKFGIPTVILEHGFLTNPEERAIIEKEENLKLMGQLDAQSIIDFYTGHEHKWATSLSTDYPTNCVFRGKASFRCSICKARYGTTLLEKSDGNDHYYIVTESRNRSCTVAGFTTYTCRIAANLTDKGYDVGQHTYTKWDYNSGHDYYVVTDTQPTHTEDGIHSERCRNCGNVVTSVTPAEGHTWETLSFVNQTCETDGLIHEKCAVCKEERKTVLEATGHFYFVTEQKDPTCLEDGYFKTTCTGCQDEAVTVLPATGHTMEEDIHIDPTCETDGKHVEICTACGHTTTDTLKAVGHAYAADEILLAPTFFNNGAQRFVCQNDSTHETAETLSRTAKDWQLTLIFGGTPHLFFLLIFLIIFLVRRIKALIRAIAAKAEEKEAQAEADKIRADQSTAASDASAQDAEAVVPLTNADATEEAEAENTAKVGEGNAAEDDDIVPLEEVDVSDADSADAQAQTFAEDANEILTEEIDATN